MNTALQTAIFRRRGFSAGRLWPALWLRSAGPVDYALRHDDDTLYAWVAKDRSGLGHNAVQATEARQPEYAAKGINGRNALSFALASTHNLTVAAAAGINNLPLDGGFYALFVLRPSSLVDTDFFASKNGFSPTGGWRLGVGNTGAFEFVALFSSLAGKWRTQDGLAVAGTPLLFEISYDATSAANDPVFRFNGALTDVTEADTPSGTYGPDTTYPLTLGGNQGVGDYDGMIGEVVVCDRILRAAEQAALRAIVAEGWGIPLS